MEEALDSLGEDQVVKTIRLDPVPLWNSEKIRQEIFDYLTEHFPKELKAATSSSGNLHNPALRPLMPGFRDAVLATSYVAELEELMARYDHRIVRASFEKFWMSTIRELPSFPAITWLEFEKVDHRGEEENEAATP